MSNKNSNGKVSLNDKLINIIIFLIIILMICTAVIYVIKWKREDDILFIISGFLSIVGAIINIYFFSKEKSKKVMEIYLWKNQNHYG